LDAALTPVYISNEIYLQQQHGEDLFFVDHWARYHPASRRIRIYLRSDEYEIRGSHVVDLCVDTWTVSLVAVIPRDFYVYDISPDHRYLLGTTIGKNTRIEKNEFGYFALRNVNVLDLETGAVSVLRSMKVKKEGNTSGTMFNYDW
jgi:hypothetical protein